MVHVVKLAVRFKILFSYLKRKKTKTEYTSKEETSGLEFLVKKVAEGAYKFLLEKLKFGVGFRYCYYKNPENWDYKNVTAVIILKCEQHAFTI